MRCENFINLFGIILAVTLIYLVNVNRLACLSETFTLSNNLDLAPEYNCSLDEILQDAWDLTTIVDHGLENFRLKRTLFCISGTSNFVKIGQ